MKRLFTEIEVNPEIKSITLNELKFLNPPIMDEQPFIEYDPNNYKNIDFGESFEYKKNTGSKKILLTLILHSDTTSDDYKIEMLNVDSVTYLGQS